LEWYHTIDLGEGIVTPGIYDHRPYLEHYGIPQDLTAKTALDVGAASGFFSFEMERRGARVTAIDLPTWGDHDFGPNYEPDLAPEDAQRYLHEPFLLARQALGSQAEKLEMTVYDITPESIGVHDLVFCGSLLIHVTDPIRALWNMQSVTGDQAIIATPIHVGAGREPQAQFVGHQRGDGWWIPNRACLEAWVQAAGFVDWEWVSDFRLDYRDGRSGPYHGVIRAWNRPSDHRGGVTPSQAEIGSTPSFSGRADPQAEIERLQELVAAYEEGLFMRMMRWIHQWRERMGLS
jgi:tRNA (mo5U34)-methyltransferase